MSQGSFQGRSSFGRQRVVFGSVGRCGKTFLALAWLETTIYGSHILEVVERVCDRVAIIQ